MKCELQRLCWSYTWVMVVIVVLFHATALRAQERDPAISLPADRWQGCFGTGVRELFGVSSDTVFAKIEGDPDTTVISPSIRDFLEPNVPNPIDGSIPVAIGYTIAKEGQVDLKVYDFFFREVLTLVSEPQTAGRHVFTFAFPAWLSSGMYFYELHTSDYRELRRLMYIK